MGKYNEFAANRECERCGVKVDFFFQAEAGILDYSTYRLGDSVSITDDSAGEIGPSPEAWEGESDFWLFGVGACPKCSFEQWVKIRIKNECFFSCECVPEPTNPYDWGKS